MRETKYNKINIDMMQKIAIGILCIFAILLDFIHIQCFDDEFHNRMLFEIIQQLCGAGAAILLMIRSKIKLFGKPQNLLFMIPCIIIAIDNFPFSSYFNGRLQLARNGTLDYILFSIYCLSVGLFEECIFRGIIFSVLAGCFSKDKKGFLLTYVVSSLVFGGAHLFNLFGGAGFGPTILQVGYTILTGGLFGFALIKTKNIFCAACIHALYNFCGLLFSKQGMGNGIVFDSGTVITMLIVSVCIGVFVLYKVYKYSESERLELYDKLGVKNKQDIHN